MEDLLNNERFAAAYERLGRVSLHPWRHTASDARTHADAVARMAARLALANGCAPAGGCAWRTRERWLRPGEVDSVPLVSEDLRTLLRAALDRGAGNG